MLTQAELDAVKVFARDHGRSWKAELQRRWEHANCSPELMRVRNKIGPSGLAAIRQADLQHPPTPRVKFDKRTPIMPDVVAETCLGQRRHDLTPEQVEWFVKHVDVRTRWFHTNNAEWKRSLESKGNQGRDQLYVWVNHWLDAYLLDPERYQKRNPISN